MLRRDLTLLGLALLAAACGGAASTVEDAPTLAAPEEADRPLMTAEDWAKETAHEPPCPVSATDLVGQAPRALPGGAGTVRLPAAFVEDSGATAARRSWTARGVGHIKLWLTPDPAPGLASGPGMRIEGLESCRGSAVRGSGLVLRFQVIQDPGADTAYAAGVYLLPWTGRAINVMIQAVTPEVRDQLTAALLSLEPAVPDA